MTENGPEVIYSRHCKKITMHGEPLEVGIYRLETSNEWALEVINQNGTSTVWDDLFSTDGEAYDEFLRTLQEEGVATFRDAPKVTPFPHRKPSRSE